MWVVNGRVIIIKGTRLRIVWVKICRIWDALEFIGKTRSNDVLCSLIQSQIMVIVEEDRIVILLHHWPVTWYVILRGGCLDSFFHRPCTWGWLISNGITWVEDYVHLPRRQSDLHWVDSIFCHVKLLLSLKNFLAHRYHTDFQLRILWTTRAEHSNIRESVVELGLEHDVWLF